MNKARETLNNHMNIHAAKNSEKRTYITHHGNLNMVRPYESL